MTARAPASIGHQPAPAQAAEHPARSAHGSTALLTGLTAPAAAAACCQVDQPVVLAGEATGLVGSVGLAATDLRPA